jgi:hypothetical protein
VWAVRIPDDNAYEYVRPTPAGLREMVVGTLKWRPAEDVIANLRQFRTFASTAGTLAMLLSEPP